MSVTTQKVFQCIAFCHVSGYCWVFIPCLTCAILWWPKDSRKQGFNKGRYSHFLCHFILQLQCWSSMSLCRDVHACCVLGTWFHILQGRLQGDIWWVFSDPSCENLISHAFRHSLFSFVVFVFPYFFPGEYQKTPHFVPKNPRSWCKMSPKNPKCIRTPPPPTGGFLGTFWVVAGGGFGTFWGGAFGTFWGVLRYISGGGLVHFGGFHGTFFLEVLWYN